MTGRAHRWRSAAERALVGLFGLNLLAAVLGTVDRIAAAHGDLLAAVEAVSVAAFTVEYAARLLTATAGDPDADPVRDRLRYAARPLSVVDALAVVPFYLALAGVGAGVAGAVPGDLRVLRAFRLLWTVRALKLARHAESARRLCRVVRRRRADLAAAVGVAAATLLVAATLVYYAERGAQPGAFGSIPAALWWAVVTLTTVGYGDVYPVTTAG